MTNDPSKTATLWRSCKNDWRNLIHRALDGDGPDSLVTEADGVAIGPLYPQADGQHIFRPRQPWTVVQRSDDPDPGRARLSLAADLAGGATGIELIFDGSAAADRTGFGLAAAGLDLVEQLTDRSDVQVRLDAGVATLAHFRHLAGASLGRVDLCFDPLADGAARGGFERSHADIDELLIGTAKAYRDGKLSGCPVAADGRIWAAGGATPAQEIAGILGSLVHSVRVLAEGGLAQSEALESIGLIADAGPHQTLTIAKLRALRLCHARIVEVFGVTPLPAYLHAETSWRMMTRDDVHTNILRATSAAFAAGVGGADSITVLPCNLAAGVPDERARRIARNTQIILLDEASLARVADPGAGAGAIEALTEQFAEAAWDIFREIESNGGLAAALRAGSFQAAIGRSREERAERIARRQIAITGISTFAAAETTASGALPRPERRGSATKAEEVVALLPTRDASLFEAVRDRATALADDGRLPKVFLANLGPPAEYTDAAGFAVNLFAAGGIPAINDGGFDTPEAAAEAFAASGARAACVCGGTDMLARHAEATAEALKRGGAARVYIVGKCSEAFDGTLDSSTDVVAILNDLLTLA